MPNEMLDLKFPVDPKDPNSATVEDLLGVIMRTLNRNGYLVAGLVLPTNTEIKTGRVFGNNNRETIKKMFATGVRLLETPGAETDSRQMGTKKAVS